MNYYFFKGAKILVLLLLSVCVCSCSSNGKEDLKNKEVERIISLGVKSIPNLTDSDKSAEVKDLFIYIFDNEKLVKVEKNVKINSENKCVVSVISGVDLYFLANLELTDQLKNVAEGTLLKDFKSYIYKSANGIAKDIFLSGNVKVAEGVTSLKVDLLRGVARIDLDIVKAPDFKINTIELVGLYTETYIWSNGIIKSDGVTFNQKFATPPSSKIDLYRIFETSTPVNINVYGTFNGIPVTKKLKIDKVERNNKYTIVLKGIGESISSTINVLPWNEGKISEIEEDKTGAVLLKNNYSTLPSGVSIDESKNEVKVSHKGGNMTLALASNTKVSISSIDGKGNVTVKDKSSSQKDGYVVSLFDVSVPAQKNGMLGYNVILNVKRPELENVYDYVVIKVEQSPKQIATVKLGGVEWMAYNSCGQDLQMQVYELDGYTQEDMYSKNWPATIGYLFQWGKKYPYKPYISGSHNAGNQGYLYPWTASTHVPCPDGYRVPTPKELRDLMPNGQTFPGTYKYNGEEVVVTLNDKGSVKVGDFTCRARYLEFKSKATGNVLRIPLSGGKGDKSGAKDASFGKGFKLWSNETTGQNGHGGYAWAAYYWPNDATSFTIPKDYKAEMESYSYVRCIKK